MPRYDSAVLNGTVVIPFVGTVRCDIGIRDGRIAALADSIASADAEVVVDARERLVLPGGIDSHFHIGIYRDLATDASSETASALRGGVTTVLLPHGPELSQQERPVPDDLPGGRRGDHGPRVHRFRLPHRCHDERTARRGRLARR